MDLLLFPSYLIMLAVSAIGCFPHYQHMKKESKLFVLFSIVSKPESRLYKMFFFASRCLTVEFGASFPQCKYATEAIYQKLGRISAKNKYSIHWFASLFLPIMDKLLALLPGQPHTAADCSCHLCN